MLNKILRNAFLPEAVTSLESIIPSLESEGADGSTVVEREYEIYGRVDDLSVLKEKAARTEYQEQWGMPCNAGSEAGISGNIRVRMTREGDDGEQKYTMTIKVKGKDSNQENEMEITEDTFNIFSSLVPNGLIKTRYIFPVRDTEFELEVDVFQDADGNECNIVKIDLEVPEGTDVNAITMPFKLEEPRLIKPGQKSQEDLDYVRKLFSEQYEVKNPQHTPKAEEGTDDDISDEDDTSADDVDDQDTGNAEEGEDSASEEPQDNAASIS